MQSVNANEQPLRLVSFPLSLEAGSANQGARLVKLGFGVLGHLFVLPRRLFRRRKARFIKWRVNNGSSYRQLSVVCFLSPALFWHWREGGHGCNPPRVAERPAMSMTTFDLNRIDRWICVLQGKRAAARPNGEGEFRTTGTRRG